MKNLPSPNAPLVGTDGRPTSALLEILPNLSAQDVVIGQGGVPTPLFRTRLQAVARTPLPSASAALVNRDGTPTRTMTALLMGLS